MPVATGRKEEPGPGVGVGVGGVGPGVGVVGCKLNFLKKTKRGIVAPKNGEGPSS